MLFPMEPSHWPLVRFYYFNHSNRKSKETPIKVVETGGQWEAREIIWLCHDNVP